MSEQQTVLVRGLHRLGLSDLRAQNGVLLTRDLDCDIRRHDCSYVSTEGVLPVWSHTVLCNCIDRL